MKNIMGIAAVVALLVSPLRGEDEEKRSFRVYPLNTADAEFIVRSVETVLDGAGKIVHDKRGSRLLISTTAAKHAEVKQLLAVVNVPAPNVRIEVEMTDIGQSVHAGGGLTGRGTVTIGPGGTRGGARLSPRLEHRTTTRSSSVRQNLLVQSGGTAVLDVGQDVPYLEWIIQRGRHWGYVEQGIRMQRVGAFLRVQPHCLPDGRVTIKLTPELSGLVGNDLRRVQYTRLQSEVTTQDGQPITLGAFGEHQEFYDRFLLGMDRGGRERKITITLTPRVLPTMGRRNPAGPPAP